jgi:hypothetical protein
VCGHCPGGSGDGGPAGTVIDFFGHGFSDVGLRGRSMPRRRVRVRDHGGGWWRERYAMCVGGAGVYVLVVRWPAGWCRGR